MIHKQFEDDDPNRRPVPFDRLSEAQRQCLRLVHQHKTSKEIALLLGVSRYTVDQRLERACRALGVGGRGKAAVLLAQHEQSGISERLVYGPLDIADASTLEAPIETPDGAGPIEASHVAQGQAAYDAKPRHGPSMWRALVPGGNADDLTTAASIKWIVALTVQIAIALLTLLAIAQAASSVVERIWPAHTLINS